MVLTTRSTCAVYALSITVAAAAFQACGGQPPPASEPAGARAGSFPRERPAAAECGRTSDAPIPRRASLHRQSSGVALVASGSRTFAYIADSDSSAIHTVDVDRGVELASTKVPGGPSQLLVLPDGRVAASLHDAAGVAILEPDGDPAAGLALRCRARVPDQPAGLALSPDDATLLVASSWVSAMTALDAATMRVNYGVSLPRDAQSVVVDDAGERAYVSHSTGTRLSVVELGGEHAVSAIDLAVSKHSPSGSDPRRRQGSQGFALAKASVSSADGAPHAEGQSPISGKPPATPQPTAPRRERIFAPMVTVDPGDPATPSQQYYGPPPDAVSRETPMVSVVDPAEKRAITDSKLGVLAPRMPCLLPRAAAYRASTGSLLVACAGIDALLELDGQGVEPSVLETRRFTVPTGPTAVAVEDSKQWAVVWSQLDGQVSIVDLRPGLPGERSVVAVDVSYDPPQSIRAAAFGRKLFHRTSDAKISLDGIACASCHPGGRDDGLTWATPDGPRQTLMLSARMRESAPYGWTGRHQELGSYVGHTVARLGGNGLGPLEIQALVGYLESLPPPPATRDASLTALEERGRQLFFAEEQGCATCHPGGGGTDRRSHDVGSRSSADNLAVFDTPSLQNVRGTAPYFHDGRYDSLGALLSAKASKMGRSSHLSQADRDALVRYLETL